MMNRRELLRGAVGLAGALALGGLDAPRSQAAPGPHIPPVIDFDHNEAKLQPISKNLYLLAGLGGNILILVGDAKTTIVDSGVPTRSQDIAKAIASVSPHPVTTLINSHWHFDHTGGNAYMAGKGAHIIGHENVRRRLSRPEAIDLLHAKFPAQPKIAWPVETFTVAKTISAGSEEVRIRHVAPAHTDSDSIIHLPGANVVHAADLFFNGFYPFIDYNSGGWIGGMIAGLDHVLSLSDAHTKIIPGHGPLATRAEVQSARDMLATVRGRIQPMVSARKTLDQVIAAKPTRDLDAKWGGVVLSGDMFTQDVYEGLKRRLRA
ncbi:cyclase [Capsulimonas corticalis]|uniref:Cyclase n=1 Tax=Capsulimonas corticalis TaxID=2219043 RepID=A0A402CVI2_9BACT|nr:MBL fold metallo-hydrolase [Capsulimonas corticalis]BDI30400.1 cyclase [Capsulimonas corticalis]